MSHKSDIEGLCRSCYGCIKNCLQGRMIVNIVDRKLLRTFLIARSYCYLCFRVCVSVLHRLDIDVPAMDIDWDAAGEESLLAFVDEEYTAIHLAFRKWNDGLQVDATFFKRVYDREKSIPNLQAVCSFRIKSQPRGQLAVVPKEQPAGFKQPLDIGRISQIRTWLATCKSSHRECDTQFTATAQPDFVPDRLIEILPNSSKLRLVCKNAEEIPPGCRYATLSHCWGKERFLTLTEVNLSALRVSIPGSGLSRTFHEAIAFCRAIRLRYLWIDSLCIMQDSLKDWGEQSSLMLDIYTRSVLNIAASASSGGSQGLFRSRPGALASPITFQLEDQQLLESQISFISFMTQDEAKAQGPLNRRAWVLQELALAPRIVHFTALGIVLECFQGIDGEPTSSNFELRDISNRAPDPVRDRHSQIKFSQCRSVKDLDKQWDLVIKDYSRTRITFAKDRVVALAGLAERFYIEYQFLNCKTKYLLGCWSHRLYFDLLWHDFSGEKHNLEPYSGEALTTPTWSWFSARMPIRDEGLYRWDRVPAAGKTIEYISASLVPKIYSMPFGPLTEGILHVRAQYHTVSLSKTDLKLEQDPVGIKLVGSENGSAFRLIFDHGFSVPHDEFDIIYLVCHQEDLYRGISDGICCMAMDTDLYGNQSAPRVRRCGEFYVNKSRPDETSLFNKKGEFWLC